MDTKNRKHASKNVGNKHNLKGTAPATAQIQMRVMPDKKTRYVWQADKEGLTLSLWIQKHMDAVCDAAGTPHTEQTKDEPPR